MKKKLEIGIAKHACRICAGLEDTIILDIYSNGKNIEEHKDKVIGYMDEPCSQCKKLMKEGFFIVGIIEEKSNDQNNPWRSGHQWVITIEKAKELFDDDILKQGFVFMDLNVAGFIGLPIMDMRPKGDA